MSKSYDKVTVAALRSAGWKVSVRHFRRYVRPELSRFLMKHQIVGGKVSADQRTLADDAPLELAPTGGETQVFLTTAAGHHYEGRADCSVKDHYCHRTGRTIALRRALEDYRQRNPATHDQILVEIGEEHAQKLKWRAAHIEKPESTRRDALAGVFG